MSYYRYGPDVHDYIPSPYLGYGPNPDYYKELEGGNALSDFNGVNNTKLLCDVGPEFEAANAALKYSDGISDLK